MEKVLYKSTYSTCNVTGSMTDMTIHQCIFFRPRWGRRFDRNWGKSTSTTRSCTTPSSSGRQNPRCRCTAISTTRARSSKSGGCPLSVCLCFCPSLNLSACLCLMSNELQKICVCFVLCCGSGYGWQKSREIHIKIDHSYKNIVSWYIISRNGLTVPDPDTDQNETTAL